MTKRSLDSNHLDFPNVFIGGTKGCHIAIFYPDSTPYAQQILDFIEEKHIQAFKTNDDVHKSHVAMLFRYIHGMDDRMISHPFPYTKNSHFPQSKTRLGKWTFHVFNDSMMEDAYDLLEELSPVHVHKTF